jgi:TonB family protein
MKTNPCLVPPSVVAPRFLALVIFGLAVLAPSPAAEPGKAGYQVMVEVKVGENGRPLESKIISSEDNTVEGVLDELAAGLAGRIKLEPKFKDGKPVAYAIRAPFFFPVPDDEGAASETLPKPAVTQAVQPVYPEALAAKGEVGGAIFELKVDADGALTDLRCLRSSHPEFAAAAEAAIRQWRFRAATDQGGPVASRCHIAVSFATSKLQPRYLWRVAPRPKLGAYQVVHPITATFPTDEGPQPAK